MPKSGCKPVVLFLFYIKRKKGGPMGIHPFPSARLSRKLSQAYGQWMYLDLAPPNLKNGFRRIRTPTHDGPGTGSTVPKMQAKTRM